MPLVVCFYCLKAYFGALIELNFVVYITKDDFLLQVTPISEIRSHASIMPCIMDYVLLYGEVRRTRTILYYAIYMRMRCAAQCARELALCN